MSKAIEPHIFWPALLVILAVCVPAMIWPVEGRIVVNGAMDWITSNFGWLYMIVTLIGFGFLGWIAFGRYGNVKLGTPEEKPQFSTLTWIAMLFCAGIGSNLIYWSIIEPIYYLQTPPFGLDSNTALAAEWAVTYPLFHWGFSAWALYCLPTIAIAYSYHVRRESRLTFSIASKSVLGRHADGWIGKAIDVSVMFGIIGGVGTSLGLGTPMIAACIGEILGVEQSVGLNLVILAIWTTIFGTSVYLGLEKGIARLSDINLWLALLLLAFVIFVGPTAFILNTMSNSLSLLLDNFFRMSLWTDPIAKSGFPQRWTIFYWAWWVAYGPMMGLFVARISKGRRLKELVLAMCLWGSIGCWLFFAIIGSYSLQVELDGIVAMTGLLEEIGPAAATAQLLASLPLSSIVLPMTVILLFVFLATTIDSSAFILASVSTRELQGNEEPARWNRLLWALVLGIMAMMMFAIGGLDVIQASSIVLAFPVLFAMLILVWAFALNIKEDYGEILAPRAPDPVRYEGGRRVERDLTSR